MFPALKNIFLILGATTKYTETVDRTGGCSYEYRDIVLYSVHRNVPNVTDRSLEHGHLLICTLCKNETTSTDSTGRPLGIRVLSGQYPPASIRPQLMSVLVLAPTCLPT